MHDRSIFVRRVADELRICKISFDEIMSDDLGMEKLCKRWIPKLQRTNRIDCCEELLKNCNQDLIGFFDRIVTEDEIWIHHYDPFSQQEAKTQMKKHQLDQESHDRLARSS